jgi:hypothetical protein
MKKTLLTLIAFGISTISIAQTTSPKNDAEKQQSKAEIFSERSGTLVQKQFIDIGNLKGAKIQVALYIDLISNQKTAAVRFEKDHYSSYSKSTDTKIALLDPDELDALIKSLSIIQDKVSKTSPADYTEVNFRSRSGFSAGCYYSKNKWSAYMKLEKFDGNSFVFFDIEDIQKFIDILLLCKPKLS